MLSVILLSIIQGIAEFLPISSSAHLIIFRDLFLFGKDLISNNVALTFDIALHFGTAVSIIFFFFGDFIKIFTKGITKGTKDNDGKIFWYIIVATIPAAIVGVLLEDYIETKIREKYIIISITLIIMGLIIYLVDKKRPNIKRINEMTLKDSIIIGLSQIFALMPGFSRSGTTIVAARLMNIDRETSAKFSFYLSTPIVLGAVLLQVFKTDLSIIESNIYIFLVGVMTSFLTGVVSILFLLNYLKSNNFKIFMWYRIILGVIVLVYLALK